MGDFLTNTLLDPLHVDDTDGFRVSMLFDRPGDVEFRRRWTRWIFRVEVGDVSNPVADLRMVVGVDVDRSGANDDLVRLNFADRLYLAQCTRAPHPGPRVRGVGALADAAPSGAADSRSTAPRRARSTIQESDVHIVDDTGRATSTRRRS